MSDQNLSDPNFHSKLGKDLTTDFSLMREIANGLVDVAIKKDASYGASWKRRGGPGAYLTAVRKADRLEAQMEMAGFNVFDVSIAPEDGESIDETLRDAINYNLLILTTRELIRRKLGQLRLEQNPYILQAGTMMFGKEQDVGSGVCTLDPRTSISHTLTSPSTPFQNGEAQMEGFDTDGSSPTRAYVDQG